MTVEQIEMVYRALRRHDGGSLRPDLPWTEQNELSLALDALRLELTNRKEGVK
ncbi:hypothetical protein DSCO28_17650 [Desulfosarcina ovata subsp. sediminis]|uniref:Uncharacterized protein n=1 Tax=Desulfosarcina ovata subsp. sediminis TaxID=885957 RepID=A0A5K7ZNH6_9BACT|nr:hypothetical protein [Desulfosarcina ovata]BBO81199.1 hypothetical protein DSCO28_17650 [Desulfosarcina ovata subsp. sediminis]